MIYASLTDNELRLAIDNAPQDIAIRDEVVRRFIAAKTADEIRSEGYGTGYAIGLDVGYERAIADCAQDD